MKRNGLAIVTAAALVAAGCGGGKKQHDGGVQPGEQRGALSRGAERR